MSRIEGTHVRRSNYNYDPYWGERFIWRAGGTHVRRSQTQLLLTQLVGSANYIEITCQ